MKYLQFFFFSTLFSASLFWSACEEDPLIEPPIETAPTTLACDFFSSGTAQTLTNDPNKPVDYIVNCVMDLEVAVDIEPGTVVEFAAGAGWYVRPSGSLKAVGTAANPITLNGMTATAGYWKGILFDSDNPNNRLEFIDIAHAGGGTFNSNADEAAIIIWGNARLAIFSADISESATYGISAIYTNSNWSIKESSIRDSGQKPAIFLLPYLNALDGSNIFTGNTEDFLIVDLGTEEITENTRWTRASVPYLVRSTFAFFTTVSVSANTLTIDPGTEIYFENGNGMIIQNSGTLVAEGTTTNPIIFQGIDAVPGAWSGIYFSNTNTPSRITNAEIRYAGAEQDLAKGGVIMRTSPSLTLDNIVFEDIDGCSIFHKSDMDNLNLTTSNLTHSNTLGTVCTE